MSFHFAQSPQFGNQSSTPPPPPPKPSTHSGRGTPATGPPLPPPPPGQTSTPLSQQVPFQPPVSAEAPSVPPPHEGWLPEILKDKTTTDLLPVVQDPALQNALIHAPQTTHPSLPASTAPLQAILNANLNLAAQLKSLEAHVQSQRQSTQARLLSLKALERQWAAKQAEQDAALEPFGPRTLYQRLTAAVSEQENICKGIEESWLDERGVADEREVSEWIKQIREARKTAWIRRERKERWDEGRVGGWR